LLSGFVSVFAKDRTKLNEELLYCFSLNRCPPAVASDLLCLFIRTHDDYIILVHISDYVNDTDRDNVLGPILKYAMLCCPHWGLGGPPFVLRAERVAKNNAENEPYFLALAVVGGMSGAVTTAAGSSAAAATALITAFTASRCAHNVVYLFAPGGGTSSAARAVAYVVGVGATAVLSVMALKGSKQL